MRRCFLAAQKPLQTFNLISSQTLFRAFALIASETLALQSKFWRMPSGIHWYRKFDSFPLHKNLRGGILGNFVAKFFFENVRIYIFFVENFVFSVEDFKILSRNLFFLSKINFFCREIPFFCRVFCCDCKIFFFIVYF